MRDHCPFQLGYLFGSLASSAACAPLIASISAMASTNAELRSNMIVLPTFGSFIDPFTLGSGYIARAVRHNRPRGWPEAFAACPNLGRLVQERSHDPQKAQ